MYSKIKISIFSFLLMSLFIGLTSCGEDLEPSVDNIDTENFRGEGLSGPLAANQRGGQREACVALVFPVSITFDDGTTASYEDRESMKEALEACKEANPEAERPSLDFPVTVVIDDTEVEVASKEELSELREACRDERGKRGGKRGERVRGKCFELVFPITVTFEDGTNSTFEDKESMREAVQAYKEANPEAERPTLVFPIRVEIDDTEMDIATQDEFDELKEACRDERGDRGRKKCFKLVFPVSVTFEDGTTASFEDRESMKAELRAYKEVNPEAERPTLVFPVTVVDRSGEETVINNEEEMEALKESCEEDDDDDDDDEG